MVDRYTPINTVIDYRESAGLGGLHDSLGYRVAEIERHFHTSELWYGDATGNKILLDGLTAIRVTAGDAAAFGSELQISDGTEQGGGSATKRFDLHRLCVVSASSNTALYLIRFKTGLTTFAEAVTLTTAPFKSSALTGKQAPIDILSPRRPCNHKIWVDLKASVNGATMDFIVGSHEYSA